MAINEITVENLGKSKAGWTWDKKRKIFFTWQVDTFFNGARHKRRGFLSEEKAKDYLEAIKLQEKLKKIGVITLTKFPSVEKLFAAHLKTIESKTEKQRSTRVFALFQKLLPSAAAVDEIKRKHFKDYSDLRLSQGVKADTVRREITPIASALHRAGDYFAELENWNAPQIYRPGGENTERDRIITKEEREKLLDYFLSDKRAGEREKDFTARRRTGLILYFGLLTGLRHGEICGLQKRDLNIKLRRLKAERFKTKKSGIKITIFEPLADTQLRVLKEAAELYPQSDYFFSETGKFYNKTYSIFINACAVLEIPYGRRTINGFTLHDARHTFVTTLEHGGMDSSTTRSFSGHSKEQMMKRYAHATFDSRARAMQIIETQIGGGGGDTERDRELKRIFDNVRSKKLSFAEFKKAITDSCAVF